MREAAPASPDRTARSGSAATEPSDAPGGFPLFSEAPFLAWYHQHRKARCARRIHPSCLPAIRLWDETDDSAAPGERADADAP